MPLINRTPCTHKSLTQVAASGGTVVFCCVCNKIISEAFATVKEAHHHAEVLLFEQGIMSGHTRKQGFVE